MRGLDEIVSRWQSLTLLEPCPVPPSLASLEGRRQFAIDREGARDPKFRVQKFAWPDRLDNTLPPGSGLGLQMRVTVHHLNEIWATEMAAAVIDDLAEDGPAEFVEEAARWCFDESRHCRVGYETLLAKARDLSKGDHCPTTLANPV